jgi:hypothetical protein
MLAGRTESVVRAREASDASPAYRFSPWIVQRYAPAVLNSPPAGTMRRIVGAT